MEQNHIPLSSTITEAVIPATGRDAERTKPATLPVLHAGGFSASVDAFAWEPDLAARRMQLWFLSLLGPKEAVKALWARLIKGEVAAISFEAFGRARFCALAPEGPRRWRFFTATLRSAAGYHGVLVPEAALFTTERADFLLLPRQLDEAARLHYQFLNRRLDLPLHSNWADWLWERALGTGEAVALEAQRLHAYR
ncbi:hypothetical protein, partial [Nitrolancea hollandica]|uniref:hypothetical protein n=1 Tax=Nitrolancea hollandica TaxID=1206749 RepID=UPI00058B79DC